MSQDYPTARDPVLSVFQSAAAGFLPAAAAHVVARRTGGAPAAVNGGALTCAELGLDLLHAVVAGDAARVAALRDRLAYSSCDPRWAETLVAYAADYLPDGRVRDVPYVRHAAMGDFVVTAARADLRVALVSDWGTGTAAALAVAALMAEQKPDVVIHLGDIYFSGTAAECERHFLAPMRAAMPEVRLFTLCGNHDVYSGGQGYYGLLREIGQPASYFCLRSPDDAWQVLAMDTGLHDRNPFDETDALTWLEPGEADWHVDKVRGFGGRTILLSHHQPFSRFRQIGPAAARSAVNANLMGSYGRLAAAGRVDAWFWGHEHRLCVYAPYRGVAAGRNIGFGAIPVAVGDAGGVAGLEDAPGVLVEVGLDVVDGVYARGFALLDFVGGDVEVGYWAVGMGRVWGERLGGVESA